MGTTRHDERRRRLATFMGVPRSQDLPPDVKADLDVLIANVQKRFYRFYDWEFLKAEAVIPISATSKVDITTVGTALSAAGADLPSTMLGEDIRIRVGGNDLRIASFTDASNAVLREAAPSDITTAVSGEIWSARYLVPAGGPRTIESVTYGTSGDANVSYKPPSYIRELRQQSPTTGAPRFWTIAGHNTTTKLALIELWPNPSGALNLIVAGRSPGTITVADADLDSVPDYYEDVLDAMMKSALYEYTDDTRYQLATMLAESALKALVGQSSSSDTPKQFELDPQFFGPQNLTRRW